MIGSFINVLIYRLPQGRSVSFPASHCPVCQTPLRWWHNIPLLSWLLLRGKCAFCQTKISVQYPLIELASGVIFVLIFLKAGWNLYALLVALTFVMLLALSVIDWRYKAVPDSLNLLTLATAMMSAPIEGSFKYALLFAGAFALLRFAISYYLFKKVAFIEKLKRSAVWRKNYNPHPPHEAMGEADIMVAGTIGALLGIKLGIFAIFLAAVLTLPVALIRRHKDSQTPFIPFLAAGLFITYIFHGPILQLLKGLYV